MSDTGQFFIPGELQAPTETFNAKGEMTVAWAAYGTDHAALNVMRFGERVLAEQNRAAATHRLRFNYRSDLKSIHRFVTGDGRIFNFHGVINVRELNRELRLLAMGQGMLFPPNPCHAPTARSTTQEWNMRPRHLARSWNRGCRKSSQGTFQAGS